MENLDRKRFTAFQTGKGRGLRFNKGKIEDII